MNRPRLLARSLVVVAALAGFTTAAALVGCELAVHPDVSLAEIPPETCLPCLDASETVITEADGNVVIVPTDSLDGGDASDGDAS